jgi:hypothetical protein
MECDRVREDVRHVFRGECDEWLDYSLEQRFSGLSYVANC